MCSPIVLPLSCVVKRENLGSLPRDTEGIMGKRYYEIIRRDNYDVIKEIVRSFPRASLANIQ